MGVPAPAPPARHRGFLHVEARGASVSTGFFFTTSRGSADPVPNQVFCLGLRLVREPNMTFRRLKKVNSSGPETGPACQDADIYFPSSKSDSCRTGDLPSRSSDVYNYKTLAYSGGTLPRNFRKVSSCGKISDPCCFGPQTSVFSDKFHSW